MRKTFLPIIIEIIGIVLIIYGIHFEWKLRADIGYTIITLGSLFIALGGLIYGKILKRK